MAAPTNHTKILIELAGTFILNNVYVNCYNRALKMVESKPEMTLEESYASYIQSYYNFLLTSDGYRMHLDSLVEYMKKYTSITQVMYRNYRDVNHDFRSILAPKQIKLDSIQEEKLVRKFIKNSVKEIVGHMLSTHLYIEVVTNYDKKQANKKTGMKCKQMIIAFMNSEREQIYRTYINSDSGNKITKRNLIIAVDRLKRYSEQCEAIIRKKHSENERYKKLLQDAIVKIEHYKNQAQYRPNNTHVELPPSMPPSYGITGADIAAPRPAYDARPAYDTRSTSSRISASKPSAIVLEEPSADALKYVDAPYDENRSISSHGSDNDSESEMSNMYESDGNANLEPTEEQMQLEDDVMSSANIGDGMSLMGDKWTSDAARIEYDTRKKLDELGF